MTGAPAPNASSAPGTPFDVTRKSLLDAVAQQREAVLASIRSARTSAAQGTPAAQNPTPPRGPAAPNRPEAVAADIAATLKAIVAEEVRTQILALLDAAARREKALAEAPADARPQA